MLNTPHLIFAKEPIEIRGESSIFLAGPTPRSEHGRKMARSWRPEAIKIFRKLEYSGTLLIPEDRDWSMSGSYTDQIEWEEAGLTIADCIMFWIPRELKYMPALTTNDEWGTWKKSGKVVIGTPPEAQKVRYQRYYARKLNVPLSDSLYETIDSALIMVGHIPF